MKSKLQKGFGWRWRPVWIRLLVVLWLLLTVAQAAMMPVMGDEAYYWLFSQKLAWAYFDHPPLVALYIKAFTTWLPGSLGLRMGAVLSMIGLVWLLWRLLRESGAAAPLLPFLGLAVAMPFFHVYSLVITPDAPLLLTFGFYLWTLERYWQRPRLGWALLWALAAALLVYAKYHGGILILLSLAFRPALLSRSLSWLALAVGLLALSPHLYWQYEHDWITFQYHLHQRGGLGFSWSRPWELLFWALLLLQPWPLLLALRQMPRALRAWPERERFWLLMTLGTVGFFFLYAFRARVEVHWIAAASVPALLWYYSLYRSQEKPKRWLVPHLMIMLSLLLVVRVALLWPPVQQWVLKVPSRPAAHYRAVQEVAAGRAVLFENSYQQASLYRWHTGEQAYCRSDAYYHPTQFDLWDDHRHLQGEELLWVGNYPTPAFDSLRLPSGKWLLYNITPSFRPLKGLRAASPPVDTLKDGDPLVLRAYNPYPFALPLGDTASDSLRFQLLWERPGMRYFQTFLPETLPESWPAGDSLKLRMIPRRSLHLPKGTYRLRWVVQPGNRPPLPLSGPREVWRKPGGGRSTYQLGEGS